MQAICVEEHGDPSVLSQTDAERPANNDTQVRIDVSAAGVNFADLAKRRGTYPGAPDPPYIPGIEVSGVVDAAGSETSFTPGDLVMAYPLRGGYASSVVVDAERVFPVPEGLTVPEAAAVPIQWFTAQNVCFEWGQLTATEAVLIHAAAGGVGSAAVQVAANCGATVVATASTEAKRSFAASRGADYTIDYVDDDLAAGVEQVTDGRGVDLVLDGVGGEAFATSIDLLAPGGRVVTYGLASGTVPSVSTPELLFGNHSVIGYHLGHAVKHWPDRVFGALPELKPGFASGDLTVQIDRTFPLSDAASAHEYVQDRRTTGKVLLEVQ